MNKNIYKWSCPSTVGIIVLFVSLVMLIRSLINRNSYEILIAVVVLFIMLMLFIIGFWKSRKLKNMECGWKPPFPMTASAVKIDNRKKKPEWESSRDDPERQTLITGLDASIPLFFRLHFLIRGQFFPVGSGKGQSVFVETSILRNDTSARIFLDFPVSGVLNGEGFCQLRDIFGFFKFTCGQHQKKTINVRSAPCFGKQTHINAQSGAEDKRNKPASDIERYHMREYAPGDRFRDINWKSSEKIDALITRISTDNQEKISRIEVHLRNYASAKTVIKIKKSADGKDSSMVRQEYSLLQLWLLDRAKARLSYFLRSLMEQNLSFIFDVRTPLKNWEIENMDDHDAFLEELAGVSFVSPQHEMEVTQGSGNIYIFTTAYDYWLHSYLIACNPRPVTLFITQPSEKSDTNQLETEILQISDFASNGCSVSPAWLKRFKMKPINAAAARAVKTELFYAEVKL